MLQILIAGALALTIQNNSAALPAQHSPRVTSVASSDTFLKPLFQLQMQATKSAIIKKPSDDSNSTAHITKKAITSGYVLKLSPSVSATPSPTIVPSSTFAPTPTPSVAPVSVTPSNFDAVYQAAGAQFGVPWQILYGIHMTETGGRDGTIFNGAGSGARGPMQFMPGTFGAYQVPGHPNIDSAVDAIYAAANFVAKHGSVSAALISYGGNHAGVLAAAHARGYTD